MKRERAELRPAGTGGSKGGGGEQVKVAKDIALKEKKKKKKVEGGWGKMKKKEGKKNGGNSRGTARSRASVRDSELCSVALECERGTCASGAAVALMGQL